jgi:hypothetical protein
MPTALDFVSLASQLESKDAFSICVHVRLKDEEIHADGSLYKDSEHKSLVDAIMASVKVRHAAIRKRSIAFSAVIPISDIFRLPFVQSRMAALEVECCD